MPHKTSSIETPAATQPRDAADLLQALESLRDEIGSIAEDIISALREAGVTPAEDPAEEPKSH